MSPTLSVQLKIKRKKKKKIRTLRHLQVNTSILTIRQYFCVYVMYVFVELLVLFLWRCKWRLLTMQAYFGIHQPKNLSEADLARKRLVFDEFFYLQVIIFFCNAIVLVFYFKVIWF